MSACVRCGVQVRWVEVEDKGRIPLDAQAVYNGKYALDPDEVGRAFPISRPGLYGYEDHNTTCHKLQR